MNNINQLHADYLKAKDSNTQQNLKVQEKTNELNGVKKTISALNERLTEVNRLLSNEKKGIGETLSSDEFVSLRKESSEGEETLSGLKDFLNIQNNTLTVMRNDRGCSSQLKNTRQKIIEVLTKQAANEITKAEPNKLKNLMHSVLVQQDIRLSNHEVYEAFYKQVGKILCEQVFTNIEISNIELPTIQQASSECDALIEKLA